jgi:hypothetical protein
VGQLAAHYKLHGTRTIRLSIKDVVVDDVSDDGFWVGSAGSECRLYVVPAEGELIRVRRGETVSMQGEIRYRTLRQLPSGKPTNQPYLYSYIVRPAWDPDIKPEAAARR